MSSSRDDFPSRRHDYPELVNSLNELLERLHMKLPFPLESPFDLTPSLLLGILESILECRLPIPSAIRASRDFASKVQAMKIFLGVFETDVLGGLDVGLSDIDPRRLAAGEEDEVVFIGELLRWLGRQRGILSPEASPSTSRGHHSAPPSLPLNVRQRALSPSTHSTVTSGVQSNLSMVRTALAETDTTVMSVASESLAPLASADLPEMSSFRPPSDLAGSARSRATSSRPPPRCIHEVEDPSFLAADADTSLFDGDAASVCRCAHLEGNLDDRFVKPTTPSPVRRDGWIQRSDEKPEVDFYHSRRTPSSAPATIGRRATSYPGVRSPPSAAEDEWSPGSGPRRIITPHNAPTQYTVALLEERARLLEQLAQIKAAALVK
ncbi:hypothetical protein BD414DRAFT_481869 [Trametes punicea]|nr:hypothetical protein BD414DRAFT_481869 [Trametes punicea]